MIGPTRNRLANAAEVFHRAIRLSHAIFDHEPAAIFHATPNGCNHGRELLRADAGEELIHRWRLFRDRQPKPVKHLGRPEMLVALEIAHVAARRLKLSARAEIRFNAAQIREQLAARMPGSKSSKKRLHGAGDWLALRQ